MGTSLPEEAQDSDNTVTEQVDTSITPPPLVADDTFSTATSSASLSTTCAVSNSHQLAACFDNNNMDAFRLALSTRSVTTMAAAHDATELARSIRITQAVFSQHGLDPMLATEWAMRRQESERSVCSFCLKHCLL